MDETRAVQTWDVGVASWFHEPEDSGEASIGSEIDDIGLGLTNVFEKVRTTFESLGNKVLTGFETLGVGAAETLTALDAQVNSYLNPVVDENSSEAAADAAAADNNRSNASSSPFSGLFAPAVLLGLDFTRQGDDQGVPTGTGRPALQAGYLTPAATPGRKSRDSPLLNDQQTVSKTCASKESGTGEGDPLNDIVRQQLEALLAEKARLQEENNRLSRENESLQELLAYTTQSAYDEDVPDLVDGLAFPMGDEVVVDVVNTEQDVSEGS